MHMKKTKRLYVNLRLSVEGNLFAKFYLTQNKYHKKKKTWNFEFIKLVAISNSDKLNYNIGKKSIVT